MELFERESEVSLLVQREHNSVTAGGIAMILKYIGAQVYADVAVASGGDMTLAHGASVGAKAVDTGTGSASDGVFDLSTPAAAADTYGELAALINASSNWRCILVDVCPTWKTDNTLYTRSATEVTGTANGLPLYLDAGVVLNGSNYVLPIALTPAHRYADYSSADGADFDYLLHNPTKSLRRQRRSKLARAVINGTAASGAFFFNVYKVKVDGTVEQVYSEAGAASASAYTFAPAVTDAELQCDSGESLIAAYETATAAITACLVSVIGRSIKSGVTEGFRQVDGPLPSYYT